MLGALIILPMDRGCRIQNSFFRWWARRVLTVCGVRVEVFGAEALRSQESYVFVANHASLIDVPILVAHTPVAFCFLVKRELFRVPVLGAYLRRHGHIPVDRADPRSALRSMKEAIRVIRQRRRSLLFFPEGTRSVSGLGDFKEGAALLAIHSGLPVVPVGIIGTRLIMPSKSVEIRSGCVALHLGSPIPTAGLGGKDRGPLTRFLREEVARLSREHRDAAEVFTPSLNSLGGG
jgi:1-acyl-sn-glycerol-3-phosphate acyltransferase